VVSALAIDSGRVCHFVSWPERSPEFDRRVERELGEVVVMHTPDEVIAATVASSAIPGVFEPVPVGGRHFIDAGGFSNQPLHVALADGADAVLIVLLSSSSRPSRTAGAENIMELGGRLLELANWRDLQAELRHLPEGFRRTGDPARVCVVEPDGLLPGGVLTFDPVTVGELITRGERDAWRALANAGWVTNDRQPLEDVATPTTR
jgi:predicted acylesterase/phospholipase RssA